MKHAQLKECRVLVTPTSFGKCDPRLIDQLEDQVGEVIYNSAGRPLTSAELVKLIPGMDGFIAGLDSIDRKVIEAADRLKVISRYGVGVDAVDLEAASEKGIVVTNTPGANSSSVAELAVGLMLALARNIPLAAKSTGAGQWRRMSGVSLEGKTVGIIGLGSIGKQVARRLQGFKCTILAYDPVASEGEASILEIQFVEKEQLILAADFITLHCPLTEETREMVNQDFISKMKAGSYLVNTARGELVDETAVFDALVSGKIHGAALDVFSKQPPDPDNPLLSLPQVIATPHMASHTDGATNAMGWGALNDCLAVLRGKEPLHRII